MKFLKRLFYFLMFLFALVCAFVMVCAFRPDVTQAISQFLYPTQLNTLPTVQSFVESVPENSKTQDTLATDIVSTYLPPSQSELVIPESVSGKNGYQEITEDGEEVADNTASDIQKQLGMGSLGENLTFDARFYPYYAMLTDTQKNLYRQIFANATELYPAFSPVEKVSAESLKNIFYAVYNDHPELFWLETAYTYKYTANGVCVEIGLFFNRTSQDLESSKAIFSENANLILTPAQTLPDNYAKEKFVHDALLNKISYNLNSEMNQSAYSSLVNGETVCAGYARAFQYLLQQLGIPCYYATGYAGESHAWNIVLLDGEYYNVDSTWNDTGAGIYDYFNKTDADYASTHIRQDLSIYLPPCNGEKFRNLETAAAPIDTRRTLSDLGMTEDQVLTDLSAYYGDCYNQLIQNGKGKYTFYNVIEGSSLLSECTQCYTNNAYIPGYMESAARSIGVSAWELDCISEDLQNNQYLLTHTVSFW